MALSTPADAATVTDAALPISGTTSEAATIVISGGASDLSIDSTGKFSASYPLVEGENELVISAISADGRQFTLTRNVFYTQENLQ